MWHHSHNEPPSLPCLPRPASPALPPPPCAPLQIQDNEPPLSPLTICEAFLLLSLWPDIQSQSVSLPFFRVLTPQLTLSYILDIQLFDLRPQPISCCPIMYYIQTSCTTMTLVGI